MSTPDPTALPEPDPTLSSDSTHSTYSVAPAVDPPILPTPGPGTVEERGVPGGGATQTTSSTKRSSS